MSKFLVDEIDIDSQRGVAIVSAGVSVGKVRERALRLGWDMRVFPTTLPQDGTVGGFVNSCLWGAGSCTYGSAALAGNITGLDLLSITSEPSVVSLRQSIDGSDVLSSFVGSQGTIAAVTKVHLALSPAYLCCDAMISFPLIECVRRYHRLDSRN